MGPEIQNRFNEVKYECAGDPVTLKKVATVEGAWRSARSGFFARAFAYIGVYFLSLVLMSLAWVGGLEGNTTGAKYRPVADLGLYKLYSYNKEENAKIINQKLMEERVIIFLPGVVIIALYHLFIVVPRRREYVLSLIHI